MSDTAPAINQPAINQVADDGDKFLEYIFSNQDSSSTESQAFAIFAYSNPDNLSPSAWYQENVPLPKDSVSSTTVDGYEAVKDGNSYYISASNIDPTADAGGLAALYNNMYVITFSDDLDATGIPDQIIDTIRFNYGTVSYAECEGSDKQKLVRDTKRVNDLGTIIHLANQYYAANGTYPVPKSTAFGSYLDNITVSVWNSWNGALGNALGEALPEDPYNFFYAADQDDPWNGSAASTPWVYSGDDTDAATNDCENVPSSNLYYDTSGTCWDPVNLNFYCPAESHTYLWKADPDSADTAAIYAHLEYDSTSTETYRTTSDLIDPCAGSTTSECRCYNYGRTGHSTTTDTDWTATDE
jgi:hypothetical protein